MKLTGKLASVCTTAVMAAALVVGGVSAAHADEAPLPEADTTTVSEVAQEPVIEPAPAVVEAPVAEEAVAPVITAVATPLNKLAYTGSDSGALALTGGLGAAGLLAGGLLLASGLRRRKTV